VAVNLTVSDETLLGAGREPAWLSGLGPVPGAVARDLVASAVRRARATLRRLYVAPGSGALVAMDSRARAFPDNLELFIDLRDQTCRTPWCDAPVRHHDHLEPWATGGTTSADNGQGLCASCNYAKQAPGWRSTPVRGPSRSRHVVDITTPTGHRHRSRAPARPRPATSPMPTKAEIYLSELVLAG
jgi:hypothetical protein